MAGKYALYLPYKVLDSLSSGNVTDSQFREFIMGLAEYDRTGSPGEIIRLIVRAETARKLGSLEGGGVQ